MKTVLVAAGAAALAFAASHALAAPTPAVPKQPIPYSQLDAYLKASHKQQMAKDWSAGAETGTAANTSATAAATPSLPSDASGASTTTNPPSLGGESKGSNPAATGPSAPTTVNPSATAPPGPTTSDAPAATTPPK